MIKYFLFTAIAAFSLLLTSCDSWLDVQPEASVGETELFSTREGFANALNGIYTRCAQSDFYGGEFSVGTPEALAQNYTNSVYDYTHYMKTSLFDYTDAYFKTRMDSVWSAAYSAIANCNLILQNIDNHQDLFSNSEYGMIKGEALALRAYVHFDMLRCFGSSYLTGADRAAIPYVTDYSNKVTPLSSVKEVTTKALKDLNEAKSLMSGDPILSADYEVGYPDDDDQTETDDQNLFWQNRRHRMNYYAVCGELARIYLYVGDHTNALKNATEVIEANKFKWTDPSDFLASDPQQKDRIMYNELVFGWYADAQETNLYNRFNSSVNGQYVSYDAARNIYEVGGVGAEDYRFKAWFTLVSNSSSGNSYQISKYKRDDDVNLHPLMIPAIRLSELYYIAAECSYDSNPDQAWDYLNTVRFHRGIGTELSDSSGTSFETELLKEYRKETFAEGQYFFACKRLNRDIVSQTNVTYPASPEIYILPLPDDEIEFGNR